MQNLSTQWQQWKANRQARRITLDRARIRAARGATYLDSIDPGWYERLDPFGLALDSGSHCVLGQLHGEFRQGLGRADILHMSSAPRANLSPVSLGFLSERGLSPTLEALDYQHLDQAWQEEIERRQPALPPKSKAIRAPVAMPEYVEEFAFV